jgi:hypothetical protein
MAVLANIALECTGCTEPVVPAGFDQVVIGLAFALVALIPVGLVHRALRRRGF